MERRSPSPRVVLPDYGHRPPHDPARLDHAMERMQAEVGRMRLLADELALLAHLDAARPLDREPVDVVAPAGEVWAWPWWRRS